MRLLIVVLLALGLTSCGDRDNGVVVAAKNFGESRILAHMMAELLKENGIPVAGVVDYPNSQTVLEALKQGVVDVYPEYNGTGLVLLGQNPIADGDAATARVRELYEPLGYSWRQRFGFANNYALAMTPARAKALGVTTMSDLARVAGELRLGIEDDFQKRPLDGLQPMNGRYDYGWNNVRTVSLDDRGSLYELLLDSQVDVAEVYTTDGQLADYGLVTLEDDLGFFPVYEAAPVARAPALAEHDGMAAVLDSLGGKIDTARMQALNRAVDIEGRQPRAIARMALAELGLIDDGGTVDAEPFVIAASPTLVDGAAALKTLRAARIAFSGSEISVVPDERPIEAVASGRARLALVGAEAFFSDSTVAPVRTDRFEADAVVDRSLVHLVARKAGGPADLAAATRLLTGPEGSSSHQLAGIIKSGLDLRAEIAPQQSTDVAALTGALGDGDVAVITSPEGSRNILNAFIGGNLELVPLDGWSDGANLVRFPFLRPDSVAANTYPGQDTAVPTLGTQLVLAGPAEKTDDAVGDQGPSSIQIGLLPLAPSSVRQLNAALGVGQLVDPTLPQASALAPELPKPPAAINPAPDLSILSIGVTILLVWLIWLFIRPEYR